MKQNGSDSKKRTAAEADLPPTEKGSVINDDDDVACLEPGVSDTPLAHVHGVPLSSVTLSSQSDIHRYLAAIRTTKSVNSNYAMLPRTPHQMSARCVYPQLSPAGIVCPSTGIGTLKPSTNTNYFPPHAFNSNSEVYGIVPLKLKPLLNPSKRPRADRQIMKLSVGLAATYNAIAKKHQHDDCELRKKGHYSFTTNEIICGRYQLEKRVGMGSSGQVFEAIDTHDNRRVALKIYRAKKASTMQAKMEIKILTAIKEDKIADADEKHIVQILDSFALNGHRCIVLEPLTMTLYKLIAETKFHGVSLGLVRTIATQLLKALDYLARKDIVHSDVKPENVMLLRDANCSYIKLIDFASACKCTEMTHTYIQSRFYRSPEIILQLSYGVSIDMWSLGCMLVELYTGEPLFAGENELDMMQRIVTILGMPPDTVISQMKKNRQLMFFEKEQEGWWAIKQTPGLDASQLIIPSHDPIASLRGAISRACVGKKKPQELQEQYDDFVDMIFQMLSYEPKKRLRPCRAVKYHPFIVKYESQVMKY